MTPTNTSPARSAMWRRRAGTRSDFDATRSFFPPARRGAVSRSTFASSASRSTSAAFKESSRAAFELASKLAVKNWVYEDRWCDDAVRQIVFLRADEKEMLAQSADDLKAKLMPQILERHELMYKERTPEACERSL